MRWFLFCAVCQLMLIGCAGLEESLPSTPAPEDPLSRDLAVEISGSVTLNGSSVTDPSYHNGPFTALVDGRVNTIALLTLAPSSIPAGSSGSVLAQFTAATTSYGSLAYPMNGGTNYMPLYLTKSEPFGVNLYNSATVGGKLSSSAVKWDASVRTVTRLDPQEPDSDDNGATFSDRTTAPILSAGTPKTRWLFQRTAGTNQDLEDWHKVNLFAGNRYRVDLNNSNGTYGTFSYDVRLITSAGSAIVNRLGVTGTSTSFEITASTDGTFYVQVAGTPVSRRGASVYFGEYTVSLTTIPVPVILDVSPTPIAGTEMHKVTYSATVTGEPTSWSWDFGPGVVPQTSTEANPTVQLVTAGDYFASVTASNSAGTSSVFFFRVKIAEREFNPGYNIHTPVSMGNAPSLKVVDDLVLLTYVTTDGNDLRFASSHGLPSGGNDWDHHTVDANSILPDTDLEVVAGIPVIAYRSSVNGRLKIARGLSALPSATAGWQSHSIDLSATSGIEAAVVESSGRIAVVHQDTAADVLRFIRATSTAPTTSSHWVTHNINSALAGSSTHHAATNMENRILVAYNELASEGVDNWYMTRSTTPVPTTTANWEYSSVTGLNPTTSVSVTSIDGVPYSAFGSSDTFIYSHPDMVMTGYGGSGSGAPAHTPEGLANVDGRLIYAFEGPLNLYVGTPLVLNPEDSGDWSFHSGNLIPGDGQMASVADYHGRHLIASTNGSSVFMTQAFNPW